MELTRAVEWGIAVGLVVGLMLIVMPLGKDDFSRVFWPVSRLEDPYDSAYWYPYPPWNSWTLRLLGYWPREVGLILMWLLNVVTAIWLPRVWKTPTWLVLVSPPFFFGTLLGHPFEAVFFAGITTVVIGMATDDTTAIGLGVILMLFKPQMAVAPALFICAAALRCRQWRGALIPLAFMVVVSLADWFVQGRLWVIPWLQMMGVKGSVEHWNASLWVGFYLGSLLWIPVGIWLLLKTARGNLPRELWIVTALGLLISPYWAGYSLWPLVAMAGCWRQDEQIRKAKELHPEVKRKIKVGMEDTERVA